MCVDAFCTFVFPIVSLVFSLFNLITDWMSFFQYVSAPSNLLDFDLATAVIYCILGCLSGAVNLILEVRLFRERVLARRQLRYGTAHSAIKGGIHGYRREHSLDRPDKYLTLVLPLLLSTVLLQSLPSAIINTFYINYCANLNVRSCESFPAIPCSVRGYHIPPQGMPIVQFLTLASSLISLLGTSLRLLFAPVFICRGACDGCSKCCKDEDDDDDDYDEDRERCCCKHNACAKAFYCVLSFMSFILGLVAIFVVVVVNFVDSSSVSSRPEAQWHVPPMRSNHTIRFHGSHSFSENGSPRTRSFEVNADLKQLVAHGAGGLFVTYRAKCKDILYNGLPESISISERRVDHVWISSPHLRCHAQFVKQKRRQPSGERLKESNCTGTKVWNEDGDCDTLFRVMFDRKRSPPLSFSAVPVDADGRVRNDGGNPFADACAINRFWRQQTLKASFVTSCRRRLVDCDWIKTHLSSFLPPSWVDWVALGLPFCPREMAYDQRPESCLLVDAEARARFQHVTVEIHHPKYGRPLVH